MKDTPVPKYETIAVHRSKAVGEPPLLMGFSVFFAIRDAIKHAREQEGVKGYFALTSPLTSEKIRMACVDRFSRMSFAKPSHQNPETFQAKGSF